jgi:two-component system sensor histidine kinase MtrB
VLERACAAVADGFGFERVGIVRYMAETSTLVPFAGHGLTPSEAGALPAALPIARFGAFQRAVSAGRAIFVEDPTSEDALPPDIASGFGIGSFVIVPLVADGRCLGFMTCDERGEVFTLDAAEVELLTTFGTLIAAFLEKAIEHGELRRLNELKSQFAALASHELRTPASAIYGAVRTLDEREDVLTADQRQQLRRMLTQQAKRLVELVENLLDLSRLEADSIRIVPTRLDVSARLATIVDAVVDSDAEVRVDVPERLEAIVDGQAFDRIVSNLLANAVRHGAPPVAVSAERANGELRVTIEDRGPGVSDEFVGSLFERFTRGATRSSEGAGLGLSIAQTYARAHGGTLTYERASPQGARFRLVLPGGETTD